MTADQIKKLVEQLPRVADEIDAEPYSIPETSAQVVRQAATALSTLLEERERLRAEVDKLRDIIRRRLACDGTNGVWDAKAHYDLTGEMLEALTDRAEKERSEG